MEELGVWLGERGRQSKGGGERERKGRRRNEVGRAGSEKEAEEGGGDRTSEG